MNDADSVAQLAARMLERREACDMAHAIRAAAVHLGVDRENWPSEALVRRHFEAMVQADRGESGHDALVASRLRLAEEIMTLIDLEVRPVELWLVGRAARGQVDADPRIRIRVHAMMSIGELARDLVDAGYEEPAFEVVDTRWGRLERLRFRSDGVECVVTRCPPSQVLDSTSDLFTERPIARVDLETLRRMINELERDSRQ